MEGDPWSFARKFFMKKKTSQLPAWEELLSAQTLFQSRFPKSIIGARVAPSNGKAIGASPSSSLCSLHVFPDLQKRFDEILAQVEKEAGWKTNRMEPPVLILGNFQGVRTGIRQLIRKKPLETTMIRGLRVPTIAEILRIKAYLIVKRNTTRDFIDFAALF